MKTIGLIGGISWESTQHYYQIMNEYVHTKLGGHNSVEAIIYSLNFARILAPDQTWDSIALTVIDVAKKLQAAGAELLVMAANTIHKIADQVEAEVDIPLLHIADPTAEAIRRAGIHKVGLLGTQKTMEESFYRERLERKHGLKVVVPESADRKLIERVIFEELTVGKIRPASKKEFQRIIEQLSHQGAEAVILGCTELLLLIQPSDTSVRLFDTTELHAKAAVDWACR